MQPQVRTVPFDRPWVWLGRGWADLRRAPGVSLGFGALFALASLLILVVVWQSDVLWLLPALSSGFLLVAPMLAVGLYETSRRLEAGEPVGFGLAIDGLQRNADQLAFLGTLLAVAWMMWMQLVLLFFMLAFSNLAPDPAILTEGRFLFGDALGFLIVCIVLGAIIAAAVFATTAVSVPMLVEGRAGVAEAVSTSVEAVRASPAAFLVWACLIGLFTVAGILLGFIGLALTLPILGHATWHAYRDVVAPETSPEGVA